jgi:hypothetical protein
MTRPWLVCLVLVAACGDDGGGGGGTERRLSELSTSEARDLCEQLLADLGDAQWRGVARLGCMFIEATAEDGCMTSRIDTCAAQAVAAIKANPAQCVTAARAPSLRA